MCCATLLHGRSQGQHSGDQEDGPPVDGSIGILHCQALGENHQGGADHCRDVDRQPARQHADHHAQHDAGGQRRSPGVQRPLGHRGQDDEFRVALQHDQPLAGAEHKQGVAEFQAQLVEIGADGLAVAPYGNQFEPVSVTEIDVGKGASRQARARFQRRFEQAEPVGLEGVQVRVSAPLELQFLQPPQHIEILPSPLHEQHVSAPERLVRFRHDLQVAVAEQRQQPEVEGIPEPAAFERIPGKLGVNGHAHHENVVLELVGIAQLFFVDFARVGEVGRMLELKRNFRPRLQEQRIRRAQRNIGQIGSAHQRATPDGEHIGAMGLAELRVVQEIAGQWRSFLDHHLHQLDLTFHEPLEYRCLPLDDELAPALELAKPVKAPLHHQVVAALQNGLARRHEFGLAALFAGDDDQSRGNTYAALGKRLADQDGIVGHAHLERP